MPPAFAQTLHDWQDFYMLLGGASATLMGLMFVAASLGTSLINDDDDPRVRTFITPTIIYFSLVLLLSALMTVPVQTQKALVAEFAAAGLIGAGYSFSHLPRLRRFYRDEGLGPGIWMWNLALPLCAAFSLLGAALGLSRSLSEGLTAAAIGVIIFVMVGIRDAWSATLYLVRRTQ